MSRLVLSGRWDFFSSTSLKFCVDLDSSVVVMFCVVDGFWFVVVDFCAHIELQVYLSCFGWKSGLVWWSVFDHIFFSVFFGRRVQGFDVSTAVAILFFLQHCYYSFLPPFFSFDTEVKSDLLLLLDFVCFSLNWVISLWSIQNYSTEFFYFLYK